MCDRDKQGFLGGQGRTSDQMIKHADAMLITCAVIAIGLIVGTVILCII